MTQMLIANKRAMYNEAFAAIPVFEGTSRAEFEDWLESIEILCEISGRNVRTEILNRGGIVVKRVIRSIPPETPGRNKKLNFGGNSPYYNPKLMQPRYWRNYDRNLGRQ